MPDPTVLYLTAEEIVSLIAQSTSSMVIATLVAVATGTWIYRLTKDAGKAIYEKLREKWGKRNEEKETAEAADLDAGTNPII